MWWSHSKQVLYVFLSLHEYIVKSINIPQPRAPIATISLMDTDYCFLAEGNADCDKADETVWQG